MSSRNALNPIWEETFELDVHLPDLAFIRFNVVDVTSNLTTAQRVVPVNRLKPGYRHLRLHNEMDQPLPLSQLFLCSQFNEDDEPFADDRNAPSSEKLGRKRMSFLVVHDISDASPYAILKVPENATTRDVIKQAVLKGGLDSAKEHEYVLLEEVVNATLQCNSTLPTPNQRMVGMHEMPLQVRNKWRNETKFVLKRVGQDPSWRARLGNLMSFAEEQEPLSESNSPNNSRVPSEDCPFDENVNETDTTNDNDTKEIKTKDADNFLVCVFNVSSKVSYSILQVAKTSTAQNVICQALNKSRKDSGGEPRIPEHYVLVEETDCPDHSRKANKSNKQRRILDPSENVYLVQLSWKGAGRLILEEKDKVSNEHGLLTETYSDPLSQGGISPSLRRHSRIIASGVRRISRSFYGGSGEHLNHSHHRTGSFVEVFPSRSPISRKMAPNSPNFHPNLSPNHKSSTLASATGISPKSSPKLDEKVPNHSENTVCQSPELNLDQAEPNNSSNTEPIPLTKKISKINFKKLKIW